MVKVTFDPLFDLEEMADYAGAEAQSRAAVEIEPCDGWAQHAVAHVMEMQCHQRDGIAWMMGIPCIAQKM